MRSMELEDLIDRFKEWLSLVEREDIIREMEGDRKYTSNVIKICREKVNTLKQLLEISEPFFNDEFPYEEEYIERYLRKEFSRKVLEVTYQSLSNLSEWSMEAIEKLLRDLASSGIASKKNFFQTVRGAVTGKLVTPGLFETIHVLGKKKTLERLRRTMERSA